MLIDKLKLKQGELSDYRFADKLGISHQLWQMTRTGKRDIGSVVLKAVTKTYPELASDVVLFLSGDVANNAGLVGDTTTPSEPSQNGKVDRFRTRLKGFIPWVKTSISKSRR